MDPWRFFRANIFKFKFLPGILRDISCFSSPIALAGIPFGDPQYQYQNLILKIYIFLSSSVYLFSA